MGSEMCIRDSYIYREVIRNLFIHIHLVFSREEQGGSFNLYAKIKFFYLHIFSTVDANQIFKDAEQLNMTRSGYVWIVTEQALSSQNVPSGTLGLELVGAANEEDHINDSL